MTPRTRFAFVLCLALLAPACADDEPNEVIVVTDDEIPCAGVNEAGIWESVPPFPSQSCDWFEYRARTTYEFSHGLGSVPSLVFAYLSFSSDGSSATLISGDPFRIEEQAEDYVVIRNSTNQSFYLRLVAVPSEQ